MICSMVPCHFRRNGMPAQASTTLLLQQARSDSSVTPSLSSPRLAAVCLQGAHSPDMAAGLWEQVPAFRAAALDFSAAYALASGQQLLMPAGAIASSSASSLPWHPVVASALASRHGNPAATLPAVVAVQYAQWRVLRASGVSPAAVAGACAGEALAALAAGAIDLGQLCRLVHAQVRGTECSAG